METIFVEVKDHATADFIKNLLTHFKGVKHVGVSTNQKLNRFIESLELEEDIAAVDAYHKEQPEMVRFEDVVAGWKKNGLL